MSSTKIKKTIGSPVESTKITTRLELTASLGDDDGWVISCLPVEVVIPDDVATDAKIASLLRFGEGIRLDLVFDRNFDYQGIGNSHEVLEAVESILTAKLTLYFQVFGANLVPGVVAVSEVEIPDPINGGWLPAKQTMLLSVVEGNAEKIEVAWARKADPDAVLDLYKRLLLARDPSLAEILETAELAADIYYSGTYEIDLERGWAVKVGVVFFDRWTALYKRTRFRFPWSNKHSLNAKTTARRCGSWPCRVGWRRR